MTEERSKQHAKKTLVVGVGGATSSGKTTLAKHLLALLPSRKGVMLHQDDFALPEAELPWNEALQARDWDNPVGTVSMFCVGTADNGRSNASGLPPF